MLSLRDVARAALGDLLTGKGVAALLSLPEHRGSWQRWTQRHRSSTPRSRLSGAARLADVAAHARRPAISLHAGAVVVEVQRSQAVVLTLRAAVDGRHLAAAAQKELPPLAVLCPRMVTRCPRTGAARHLPFRGCIGIGVREVESICSAQLVGCAPRGRWRGHGGGLRRGDPRVRPTAEHQQRDEHSPHRRSHYHGGPHHGR